MANFLKISGFNHRRIALLAIFVFLLMFTTERQDSFASVHAQHSGIISRSGHLSPQQLLDTANHYFYQNSFDTALVYYSLFINTPGKNVAVEQLVYAYNRAASIYSQRLGHHRTGYEMWLRALLLCEEYGYTSFIPRIYHNLGTIYTRFGRDDIARTYHFKVLELSRDSAALVAASTALGRSETNMDSALFYLNRALQFYEHNDLFLPWRLHGLATHYREGQVFDSAYHYYQWAMEEAQNRNDFEMEANSLLGLGKLFFSNKRSDSALFYIDQSIALATERSLLAVLADNYLALSEINETEGRIASAYNFFKKHTHLRDHLFNSERFAEIKQLQRTYEITKTNQEMEQLAIEQQIKERTIRLQQVFQGVILCVLLVVSSLLVYIFFQKRNLDTAYKMLVEKNIEIIEPQRNFLRKKDPSAECKKSEIAQELQDELLDRILTLMEDTSVICDPDFSIDKLAGLVQSNQKYVSLVINTVLKKNFRTFLSTYRIKEAQRLLSDPNITKYSLNSIALRVGYKSLNTFNDIFKEITGVSPSFYLKSIQHKSNS